MGRGLSIQFVALGKQGRRLQQRVWATNSTSSDAFRPWPAAPKGVSSQPWRRRTLIRMESWVSRRVRSFVML